MTRLEIALAYMNREIYPTEAAKKLKLKTPTSALIAMFSALRRAKHAGSIKIERV
jgi:hypothetical protein